MMNGLPNFVQIMVCKKTKPYGNWTCAGHRMITGREGYKVSWVRPKLTENCCYGRTEIDKFVLVLSREAGTRSGFRNAPVLSDYEVMDKLKNLKPVSDFSNILCI